MQFASTRRRSRPDRASRRRLRRSTRLSARCDAAARRRYHAVDHHLCANVPRLCGPTIACEALCQRSQPGLGRCERREPSHRRESDAVAPVKTRLAAALAANRSGLPFRKQATQRVLREHEAREGAGPRQVASNCSGESSSALPRTPRLPALNTAASQRPEVGGEPARPARRCASCASAMVAGQRPPCARPPECWISPTMVSTCAAVRPVSATVQAASAEGGAPNAAPRPALAPTPAITRPRQRCQRRLRSCCDCKPRGKPCERRSRAEQFR